MNQSNVVVHVTTNPPFSLNFGLTGFRFGTGRTLAPEIVYESTRNANDGDIVIVVADFLKKAMTEEQLDILIAHQVYSVEQGYIDRVCEELDNNPDETPASFNTMCQDADKAMADLYGPELMIHAMRCSIKALTRSPEMRIVMEEKDPSFNDSEVYWNALETFLLSKLSNRLRDLRELLPAGVEEVHGKVIVTLLSDPTFGLNFGISGSYFGHPSITTTFDQSMPPEAEHGDIIISVATYLYESLEKDQLQTLVDSMVAAVKDGTMDKVMAEYISDVGMIPKTFTDLPFCSDKALAKLLTPEFLLTSLEGCVTELSKDVGLHKALYDHDRNWKEDSTEDDIIASKRLINEKNKERFDAIRQMILESGSIAK